MAIEAPKPEQILDIASDFGLELSEADAHSFAGLIAGSVPSYNRLDELPEPSPPVKYPRTSGRRPAPEENPYNAWYWRCEIEGAAAGPLAGKRLNRPGFAGGSNS
jgi:amidase